MSAMPDHREIDDARRDARESLARYADLARVWNAPDDEHTRYQIRRLVDDVIEDTMQDLALPKRESDDGMTPLAFYAFVVRKMGIPAQFRLDSLGDWCADAPFTKASQEILDLLERQGA